MEHNGNYSGPKDSKKDDDSDNISPFSGHVHSVNKNDNGSNTDCGESNIKDSDVPTAVTNDEKENARKIAAFVEKVIHNEMIQDDKMEWPLCLLVRIYFIKIYLWGTSEHVIYFLMFDFRLNTNGRSKFLKKILKI